MSTDFHDWRRTAGCVTLVMALAFMTGWVRSFVVMDQFGDITSQNGVIEKVTHLSTASLIVLDDDGKVLSHTVNTNPRSWDETVWRIRYWSIVIPLTLISAYLLLSKPRSTTEPQPATGAT